MWACSQAQNEFGIASHSLLNEIHSAKTANNFLLPIRYYE